MSTVYTYLDGGLQVRLQCGREADSAKKFPGKLSITKRCVYYTKKKVKKAKIESTKSLHLAHNITVGEFNKQNAWLLQVPTAVRENGIRKLLAAIDADRAKQIARKERGQKKTTFNLKFK